MGLERRVADKGLDVSVPRGGADQYIMSPNTRVIIKSPSYKRFGETKLDIYRPYYTGEQIMTDKTSISSQVVLSVRDCISEN